MPSHGTKRARPSGGYGSKKPGKSTMKKTRQEKRTYNYLTSNTTKYFDCGFHYNVTGSANDWTGTEIPMDNYVNSSGTAAAYTDSAIIPSEIGRAHV